jgi:predicted DNA-binding transcriptional regulator AlpA
MMDEKKLFITTTEAASLMGISRSSLYNLLNEEGAIPIRPVRYGNVKDSGKRKHYKFPKFAFMSWWNAKLAECTGSIPMDNNTEEGR